MVNASMKINVSYTNWRGVTSVRRVLLGEVRFGTTEWHEEPTWLIKAFDLDHPAQIWKEFELSKCDFNREEIGKNWRVAELEAALQGMIDFYVEIDSAGGAPGDADISAMEPSVVVARAALKAKP
jgi:hypothetical protein